MNARKNAKKRGTGSWGDMVVARIQRHERADAQHQQREQPGEPVHAQHES